MSDELNEQVKAGERVYDAQLQIDHDLFVLEAEMMMKNIAIQDEDPDYIKIAHQHMFHTVNSDGIDQESCAPIGGHYHKMTVVRRKGKVPTVKCGPPIMKIAVKKGKGYITKEVPVNDVDSHTHKVRYLKSSKVKMRTLNNAALMLQTEEEKKTAPVPGVLGG